MARVLYAFKDLNKATTMTFGYGKELASFDKDIGNAVDVLYEAAKRGDNPDLVGFDMAVDQLSNEMGRDMMLETLHKFYIPSLREVLSDDALESRSIMRSAAMLHSITDQLFSIQSATGFQLNMGAMAPEGYDQKTAVSYSMTPDGAIKKDEFRAGQYEEKATASAIKRDKKGGVRPGGYAYGGSVTAPVQSIDAATVAMSVTGRSWDKLKSASNGNPYIHTIYDAFKMDAMGYDTVLEEVNRNWLNAGMNWSYLEETFEATKQKMGDWNKAMDQLPQGTNLDTTLDGNYRMAGWLLSMGETVEGKPKPAANLTRQFKGLLNVPQGIADDPQDLEKFAQAATSRVLAAVNQAGVDTNGEVNQMTVRQMRVFVMAMQKELDTGRRLQAMINKTNTNKKKLKKKIDAQKVHKGNEVLQYYAH